LSPRRGWSSAALVVAAALASSGANAAGTDGPSGPATDVAPATPAAGASLPPARGGADARRALQNAMRLAEALHDEDALLELYAEQARRRDASRSTLESLVDAAEAHGVPQRAVTILERRIREGATPAVSAEILARLLTRGGRARDAAAAWSNLATLRGAAGLSGEEAMSYAHMLSRIDNPEKAWEVLSTAAPASGDARAYWTARGALAWQLSRDMDAERAYQEAWQLGEHTAEARQRLGALARAHGNVAALTRLARNSYSETRDPAELIESGQAQLDAGDWKGLGETLVIARRDEAAAFADLTAYWTLQAQWLAHTGDPAAAAAAWDRALALGPEPQLAADYLWSVLAFRDKAVLAHAVDRVTAFGLRQVVETREPLALALVELGRVSEALVMLAAELRDPKLLERAAYPLATALAATGRAEAAARVQARAQARLIASRDKVTLDTPEARDLFVTTADAISATWGAPPEARWMRSVLSRLPASLSLPVRAELLARLHEVEGDRAGARTLWSQASKDRRLEGNARDRMLRLAIEDDDRPFLRAVVAAPAGYPGDAVGEAALQLQDTAAARAHLTDTASPGDDSDLTIRNTLDQIDERRAGRATAGGTFETIGPLSDYGADAAASGALGDLRLGLEASGRELRTFGQQYSLAPGMQEAEALASLRASGGLAGAHSELAAGIGYHTAGTLPRARAVHERWLGGRLLLSLRAALFERIDDAPLLRALAASNSLSATTRFEAGHFYGSLGGKVRDDRTRLSRELGTEFSEEVEGGLRLSRGSPELDVGVRGYAQQRNNVRHLPGSVTRYWPDPSFTVENQLPPSYQYVAVVARLAHGDLGERRALAGAPWPRYECGLEAGLRFPTRDPASGGQCSLGVRVGAQGEVFASALYGWGLVALARGTSARFTLGYDQRF